MFSRYRNFFNKPTSGLGVRKAKSEAPGGPQFAKSQQQTSLNCL